MYVGISSSVVGVPGFYPILRREVVGCVILSAMHARWAGIAAAAVVIGFAAGPAQAATLAVESPCQRAATPARDMTFVGTGFTPGEVVLLSAGSTTVGNAVAGADGSFRQRFQTPAPSQTGSHAHEAQFTFTATDNTDPTITAGVTFRTADVFGDYNPGDGDPTTLKVRFTAFGFAAGLPAGAQAPIVYVHYVTPKGKLKRTISLGRGSGPCGSIPRTKLRKLFPFSLVPGTWALQFDTRKTYTRGKGSSPFLWDRVTLKLS